MIFKRFCRKKKLHFSGSNLVRDWDDHRLRYLHHGQLHVAGGWLLGSLSPHLVLLRPDGHVRSPVLGRDGHHPAQAGRDLHLHQGGTRELPGLSLHHNKVSVLGRDMTDDCLTLPGSSSPTPVPVLSSPWLQLDTSQVGAAQYSQLLRQQIITFSTSGDSPLCS